MVSGKQRRQQIKARRAKKRKKAAVNARLDSISGRVRVRPDYLRPTNSYGVPRFVKLGYYEDILFRCKDCGKEEVWRGTQQKWWYEVMKGDVWTTAVRCRPCRRKERERKAAARKTHLDGLARRSGRENPR